MALEETFVCECRTLNHIVRFTVDKDFPETIFVSFMANPYSGLFKRIKLAFLYIFGYSTLEYEEVVLDDKQIVKLKDLIKYDSE